MTPEERWYLEFIRAWAKDSKHDPYPQQLAARYSRLEKAGAAKFTAPQKRSIATRRALITRNVSAAPMQRPAPPLPIDSEIGRLLSNGTIKSDHSGPYLAARVGVVDGAEWGDWYHLATFIARPNARAFQQIFAEDTETITYALRAFLAAYERDAGQLRKGGVAPDHPRSADSISETFEHLRQAESRLTLLKEALATSSRPNGRPANAWKIGFVFGMGVAWRDLTERAISKNSEDFIRFLQAGADSLPTPLDDSEHWERAVVTAVSRFRLNANGAWERRPGDDHP